MRRFFRNLLILVVFVGLGIYLFMQQASFGKLPAGSRLSRVQSSPNYVDGKFRNIMPTSTLAEGVSYFTMLREFFGKGVDREPLNDIPSVKSDLKAVTGPLTIVWFGHSSYLIHVNGKNILVDPVLSTRASPVGFAGARSYPGTMIYTAEDFPALDAIILTHDHYDHLDYKSILALKEKTAHFYAPLGVGEHLEYWGVNTDKISELDWWDSKTLFDNTELIATPARHFSGRGFTRDKTLWASYVLRVGDQRVFIGGDSGYDGSFGVIGERYGPFDIAILECGQYDRKWPLIHMMPEQTVQASVDLKAKVLMPVHWGKFTLSVHPWRDPITRAVKVADRLGVSVATPKIGEKVVVGDDVHWERWWK